MSLIPVENWREEMYCGKCGELWVKCSEERDRFLMELDATPSESAADYEMGQHGICPGGELSIKVETEAEYTGGDFMRPMGVIDND